MTPAVAIACPHCSKAFAMRDEVPPLPEALGFDCPECAMAFLVWTHEGEIRVSKMTRTGQATS